MAIFKKHHKVISEPLRCFYSPGMRLDTFVIKFIDTFRSCTASLVRPDAPETGM